MASCIICGNSLPTTHNITNYVCVDCKVKKQKRITLRTLKIYDEAHDSNIIRELEMHVDAVLTQQEYNIQFWQDVTLYGVKEALTYLQNQEGIILETKSMEALVACVNKILHLF